MPKLFSKKIVTTAVLSLLFNSLMSERAWGVIYDLNVSLSEGSTTGTIIGIIETNPGNNADGLGDYASGDFTFGDYEIELKIGENTFIQNNSNSTLLIEDLEVGDLTASSTELLIDLTDPGSPQDLFDIASLSGEGDFGLISYLSGGSVISESAMTVGSSPNISFVMDTSAIDFSLGTARVSAAVPFEFTPGAGLLIIGGLWVLSRCWRSQVGK
ncbi:hypothetical protein H1P_6420002 [Hyella patelloides LEGE 07179]|uniref:Uncharacterized protein n=1 Tax=Hyella patelloides LEGE 07179 TaxID=945734 RepID=A0A563W259_9CYAN|nr:hypothetical protein [Hyella patelloides]VEP17782.1 hypothetical protein H1P_6420002 [Hyella patelloides LEGE 07179]